MPPLSNADIEGRITRRGFVLGAVAATASSALAQLGPREVLYFYAARPGRRTIDQDAFGGNPLASALIAALAQSGRRLSDVARVTRDLTSVYSEGFQEAVVPATLPDVVMSGPGAPDRMAMVVVNKTYSGPGVPSLAGAGFDAERILRALQAAGFRTKAVIDADLAQLAKAVASFRMETQSADIALIYCTGHGVLRGGVDHLALGSFSPVLALSGDNSALWPVPDLAPALAAKAANLLFFAGCRTPDI